MQEINFLTSVHKKTKRDYLARVSPDRPECARTIKRWDGEYWDGDRKNGYGGHYYDGRWYPVAEEMAAHYKLKAGDRILDVGCGKGFLLYEFTKVVPGIEIAGIDISDYAIENSKEEVKPFLQTGNCTKLPWPDNHFDYVYSLNVLHNLENFDLMSSLKEMERVGKNNKYNCIESWRSEEEKANMLYWAVPCETFFSVEAWRWYYELAGYTGDYGFIFFE